jgi:hypothetical protein
LFLRERWREKERERRVSTKEKWRGKATREKRLLRSAAARREGKKEKTQLTSVGVDDDLAAREPGVAVGTADHEPPRGVEVEDGVLVEVLGGDHRLNDVLLEVLRDLLVGDVGAVLRRDEDGVDADGDHRAA